MLGVRGVNVGDPKKDVRREVADEIIRGYSGEAMGLLMRTAQDRLVRSHCADAAGARVPAAAKEVYATETDEENGGWNSSGRM